MLDLLLPRRKSEPNLSAAASSSNIMSPLPAKPKSEPVSPAEKKADAISPGWHEQRAGLAAGLAAMGLSSRKTELNQALIKIDELIAAYSPQPGEQLDSEELAYLKNLQGFKAALALAKDPKEFAKLRDVNDKPLVLSKVINDVNLAHARFLDLEAQENSKESPEVSVSCMNASPSLITASF